MKKHILFFVFCLMSLVVVTIVSAQTRPGANPPSPQVGPVTNPPAPPPPGPAVNPPLPPAGPGANPLPPPPPVPEGFSEQYGFTGSSQIVTVAQAQTFTNRTPVVISGSIVKAIGDDLYTFRDTSGEIIIRIGPREWELFGSIISPSNTIEIIGELHRDERDWQRGPEIHARNIIKR